MVNTPAPVMLDDRPVIAHLNYPGDARAIVVEPVAPLGPDESGLVWWPVTAEYDAKADRTRVGLAAQPPAGASADQHFAAARLIQVAATGARS